jgi:quinolinate synthase
VFFPVPGADGGCSCSNCPFMARNTLEKIYLALLNNAPRIELPEPMRLAALKPLTKMLDMSSSVPMSLTSPPLLAYAVPD